MTFNEIIKKEALEFAKANAIVSCGDIVTTSWRDWVKPHRVSVCEIGACLSCRFDSEIEEFFAELEMFYFAKRLKADGTIRPQDKDGGIVLTAFVRSDGVMWRQKRQVLNHAAYHWSLEKKK